MLSSILMFVHTGQICKPHQVTCKYRWITLGHLIQICDAPLVSQEKILNQPTLVGILVDVSTLPFGIFNHKGYVIQ